MIGTNIHNVTAVTYSDVQVIGTTTYLRRLTVWSKDKKVYEIDLYTKDQETLNIQPEGEDE